VTSVSLRAAVPGRRLIWISTRIRISPLTCLRTQVRLRPLIRLPTVVRLRTVAAIRVLIRMRTSGRVCALLTVRTPVILGPLIPARPLAGVGALTGISALLCQRLLCQRSVPVLALRPDSPIGILGAAVGYARPMAVSHLAVGLPPGVAIPLPQRGRVVTASSAVTILLPGTAGRGTEARTVTVLPGRRGWDAAAAIVLTALNVGPALGKPGVSPGLPGHRPVLGSGRITVGGCQRLRPDRTKFAQPLLGSGLAAALLGALVGRLSAKFHLCRHSPTSHRH